MPKRRRTAAGAGSPPCPRAYPAPTRVRFAELCRRGTSDRKQSDEEDDPEDEGNQPLDKTQLGIARTPPLHGVLFEADPLVRKWLKRKPRLHVLDHLPLRPVQVSVATQ